MKILYCILFTIATSVNLSAQKAKADTATIELHCGWSGYTCPAIIDYKKLVAERNYSLIRSKLANGTLTEKVLSAITIEELVRTRQIILTAGEEKAFRKVRNSNDRIEVCYTCTWHYKGTIKAFFHPKKEGCWVPAVPYWPIHDELFAK